MHHIKKYGMKHFLPPKKINDNKYYLLIGMVMLFFSLKTSAQYKQMASSAESITVISEDFEDDSYEDDWTIITTEGDRYWSNYTYSDNSYMQMNGYDSSASSSKDFVSYLISPVIDFDLYDNEVLTFGTKNGYYTNTTLSVWISTDFDGSDVENATWTALSAAILDETDNASGYSDGFTSSGELDLSSYDGNGYIAFKYDGNNTTETSTYQVDDFVLVAEEISFSGTLSSDVTNDQLSFDYVDYGSESSVITYSLSYTGVSSDIAVSTGSDFYLSSDGITWSQDLTISVTEDGSSDVMVKYVPSENYTIGPESEIEHRTNDAATYQIAISANGTIVQQDADTLDKDLTLDIVTWNLEWFGSPSNSSSTSSYTAQLEYVSEKIVELDADIYALQEVVSDDVNGDFFEPLLDALNELAGENQYQGVLSEYYSFYFTSASSDYPAQRTCFIYNTSSISNIESFSLFNDVYNGSSTSSIEGYTGTASTFWVSGRLPQYMQVIATVNGQSDVIDMVNIHAKCCSGYEDRREADATYLYDQIVSDYSDDNVIILGDYNDGVSDDDPYTTWYENDNENFMHVAGEESGIDHISVSNELYTEYYSLSNGEYSESVTISDHDPVMIRLLLDSDKSSQSITLTDIDDQLVTSSVQLSATVSSGLTPEYIVVSGDASLDDNDELTFSAGGEVIVQAIQTGNDEYDPAFSNLVSFTVSKLEQTITFEPIDDKIVGDDDFELVASASSGLDVTFEVVTGEVSIDGTTVSILDAGDVTIKAVQEGDDTYEAAEATQSFLIEDKDGIEEDFAEQVLIYPNPASDYVIVELPDNTLKTLELISLTGAVVKTQQAYSKAEINVGNLPSGLYFIQITSGDITIAKKIQVKR